MQNIGSDWVNWGIPWFKLPRKFGISHISNYIIYLAGVQSYRSGLRCQVVSNSFMLWSNTSCFSKQCSLNTVNRSTFTCTASFLAKTSVRTSRSLTAFFVWHCHKSQSRDQAKAIQHAVASVCSPPTAWNQGLKASPLSDQGITVAHSTFCGGQQGLERKDGSDL